MAVKKTKAGNAERNFIAELIGVVARQKEIIAGLQAAVEKDSKLLAGLMTGLQECRAFIDEVKAGNPIPAAKAKPAAKAAKPAGKAKGAAKTAKPKAKAAKARK